MLKMALNAGMAKSLTRQAMQICGVILISKGIADAEQVAALATSAEVIAGGAEVIAGGAASLVSVLWSIKKERRAQA